MRCSLDVMVLILVAGVALPACDRWSESQPPIVTDTVIFGARADPKGRRQKLARRVELSTTLDMQGAKGANRTIPFEQKRREELWEEVVEAIDGVATGVEVSYREAKIFETNDGEDAYWEEASKGESYRVRLEAIEAADELPAEASERDRRRISVQRLDGSPPKPEEADVVRVDYANLGLPDPIETALVGRTLSVGDTVVISLVGLSRPLEILDPAGGSMRLTLARAGTVGGELIAVFDVVARLRAREGPMEMEALLHGTSTVAAAPVRHLDESLAGSMDVIGSEWNRLGRTDFVGSGELRMELKRTPY